MFYLSIYRFFSSCRVMTGRNRRETSQEEKLSLNIVRSPQKIVFYRYTDLGLDRYNCFLCPPSMIGIHIDAIDRLIFLLHFFTPVFSLLLSFCLCVSSCNFLSLSRLLIYFSRQIQSLSFFLYSLCSSSYCHQHERQWENDRLTGCLREREHSRSYSSLVVAAMSMKLSSQAS